MDESQEVERQRNLSRALREYRSRMIIARGNGTILMCAGIVYALVVVDFGGILLALAVLLLTSGTGYLLFTHPRRNPMPPELVAFAEEERAAKVSRTK
jgi:hypothetical protein